MLTCLIMAGGRGTRFYPASTDKKPKQFLNLIGDKTMLQQTVDRILPIISFDKIFVATCEEYISLVEEQLPELPKENILVEPVGRNTAPCIVMGGMIISKKFDNAKMLVIPSDSLIQDTNEYNRIIKVGETYLDGNSDSVITIGIRPTRPETGYGYIKLNEVDTSNDVKKVEKFVEKPNTENAQKYFESKKYYWNAGMFMWDLNYLMKLAKKYMNETYGKLKLIVNSLDDEFYDNLHNIYPTVEKISVDYALMEKIDTINVIEGDFGWDDLGSWMALERYLSKDENDNVNKGNVKFIDASKNVAFSSSKPIKIIGLDNIFVIESEGQVVIGSKDKLNVVHELSRDENCE